MFYYKKIGAIDDEDFKRSIIESRNGDNIKYYISQGIKYEFKKRNKIYFPREY